MKDALRYKINILLIVVYVLTFVNGVIYLFPALTPIRTMSTISSSIVLLGISLSSFQYLNPFYTISFIAITIAGCLNVLFIGKGEWYLGFYGLMDILNIFGAISIIKEIEVKRLFPYLYKRVIWFCKIFLVFQVPFSLMQYLKYGANDNVGGTYGLGGSGMLTFMCIVCVFLLITSSDLFDRRQFVFVYNYKKIIVYLCGLLPIFINETKVSVILIPILFIGIIKFKKISTVICPALLLIMFLSLFSTYYSNDVANSYQFSDIFKDDFVKEYLTGELDETSGDFEDIPRFTKIVYANKEFTKKLLPALLGNDYGAFKGGTSVSRSEFATRYSWLLVGSRPLIFNFFIMGGIILTVLIISVLIRFIVEDASKKFTNKWNVKFFFMGIFIILLFYNDSILSVAFSLPLILIMYSVKKLEIIKKVYEIKKKKASAPEL